MDFASEPFVVLFPGKKKNKKTRWSTCTDASLHVRTTVETLELICIIYLDSNKRRRVSVCAAQLLLQASPPPHPH